MICEENACVWELSDDPCAGCIQAVQECADQDDSNYFDIDYGEPNPVLVPDGWAEMLGGKP